MKIESCVRVCSWQWEKREGRGERECKTKQKIFGQGQRCQGSHRAHIHRNRITLGAFLEAKHRAVPQPQALCVRALLNGMRSCAVPDCAGKPEWQVFVQTRFCAGCNAAKKKSCCCPFPYNHPCSCHLFTSVSNLGVLPSVNVYFVSDFCLISVETHAMGRRVYVKASVNASPSNCWSKDKFLRIPERSCQLRMWQCRAKQFSPYKSSLTNFNDNSRQMKN